MTTALDTQPSPEIRPFHDKPLILVVDDHETVRASICTYLQMRGYDTVRANSGFAALEIAKQSAFDGVLLDVQMPLMDGLETCRQLLRIQRERGLAPKVWHMSGIHFSDLREQCTAAGSSGFFQKPFNWTELLTVLARELSLPEPRSDAPGTRTEPVPQHQPTSLGV